MLLCSSCIPVSETLTAEAFVALAVQWVTNSRNYCFDPFEWDGSSDFKCSGKKQETFRVGLFDGESICAVHFKNTDAHKIDWTTDFVLDLKNHMLGFQLYRDAPQGGDYTQPYFSLPALVKRILSAGYAGSDKGLEVTDQPVFLQEENMEVMARIIRREAVYNMPVVYISCEADGCWAVDPCMVAKKLNGVAHVVAETSRAVSFKLRDQTDGNNPYAGAVEIFYSNGSRRFLPIQLSGSRSQKGYTIVNSVFQHMNQIRVEERFSWSELQAGKLRGELSAITQEKEHDSKEYDDLEQMYENILAQEESQNKRLTDQLASANQTIRQLEAQLSAVERTPVLIVGEEQDLYPLEQQSFLMELLEKERRSVAHDSRKQHILESLIAANKCENTVDEKRARLKACLHGYTRMTPAISKELQEIGFTLSEAGKHIKLVFGEDARYTGTLSKTGSDHRAGDNTAHDLIRSIF